MNRTLIVILSLCCALSLLSACSGSFVKSHVKGPYIYDDLTRGGSIGRVYGGEFTSQGWMPGGDGSISYDIPGVAQGAVEVVVQGLDRSNNDSVFITLYEPGDWNYADPYILKNPFLVTLSLNNFDNTPQHPFNFLWTVKEFPAGTAALDRYVDGLPLGGGGYEQTAGAENVPVFPEAINVIRIEWKFGKASFYYNGKKLAEHDYSPRVFNPQALKLVIGKSPGRSFYLPDLTFKNVTVSLPGV